MSDDTYYVVSLTRRDKDELFVCRIPNTHSPYLQLLTAQENPEPIYYCPWNTSKDANDWIRKLLSDDEGDPIINDLRKLIVKERDLDPSNRIHVKLTRHNESGGTFSVIVGIVPLH